MNSLDCFLDGTVICELEGTEKYEALRELIYKAPVFQSIGDLKALESAVFSRERQQSTGFGHSVAVAHGTMESLDSVRIALGISRKGIDYDSVDGEPVNLLFIVASPPDMRLEYLAALSVITGLVRNKHFREELLGSRDPQAIQTKMCKAFRETLLFRVRRFSTPNGAVC